MAPCPGFKASWGVPATVAVLPAWGQNGDVILHALLLLFFLIVLIENDDCGPCFPPVAVRPTWGQNYDDDPFCPPVAVLPAWVKAMIIIIIFPWSLFALLGGKTMMMAFLLLAVRDPDLLPLNQVVRLGLFLLLHVTVKLLESKMARNRLAVLPLDPGHRPWPSLPRRVHLPQPSAS
jgi:hypothetical protein